MYSRTYILSTIRYFHTILSALDNCHLKFSSGSLFTFEISTGFLLTGIIFQSCGAKCTQYKCICTRTYAKRRVKSLLFEYHVCALRPIFSELSKCEFQHSVHPLSCLGSRFVRLFARINQSSHTYKTCIKFPVQLRNISGRILACSRQSQFCRNFYGAVIYWKDKGRSTESCWIHLPRV